MDIVQLAEKPEHSGSSRKDMVTAHVCLRFTPEPALEEH